MITSEIVCQTHQQRILNSNTNHLLAVLNARLAYGIYCRCCFISYAVFLEIKFRIIWLHHLLNYSDA